MVFAARLETKISDDDRVAPWGDGDALCVARDSIGTNGYNPHSGDIID